MPAIRLEESEQHALRGLLPECWPFYLYLRQHVDFATGLVGVIRRISWQAIREALYVEPQCGFPVPQYTKSKVRRLAGQLERAGLVRTKRDRYSRFAEHLVFFLPFAPRDSHVQNKADIKPTPQADTPTTERKPTGSRHRINGSSRHTSGNRFLSSNQAAANTSLAEKSLAYPQACSAVQRTAIIEIARQAGLTRDQAQLVLDELRDAMRRKRVENPVKLFFAMVKQIRERTFSGAGAIAARAGGKALSSEEAQLLNQREEDRR